VTDLGARHDRAGFGWMVRKATQRFAVQTNRAGTVPSMKIDAIAQFRASAVSIPCE
jgi:hypothetical protein